MCIKNALIFFFLLISLSLNSQILIDDVGDGWKSKVDSALTLIEQSSPEHWEVVKENCNHIIFWLGNFSTTTDTSTIMIAVRDIKLGSINNLACVIVHESLHLDFKSKKIFYTEAEEELRCYLWESKFLNKLDNPEPWLRLHLIKCINIYNKD